MTTPRRRWSFGLRTLFVVVTLIGCWLSWEHHVVRERDRCRAWVEAEGGTIDYAERHSSLPPRPKYKLPVVRRLFGDEPGRFILLPDETTDDQAREVAQTFTEATVILGDDIFQHRPD